MRSFFRKDRFLAFGGFVFFILPILLYYPGVVHGDKGVLTVLAVENNLGINRIASFKYV